MPCLTRRQFLTGSSAALAALVVGGSLPRNGEARANGWPTTACGPTRGEGRLLVAYASRCGSTVGVAQTIGQELCRAGTSVDVRPVASVPDLTPYRAVVLGSPVRSARWLDEAHQFLEQHQHRLASMPVAYFQTCIALAKDNPQTRALARSYLEPTLKAAPKIIPKASGFFAGTLDYSKLSWLMGMILRRKMSAKGIKEGDYRNWQAIKAWARDTAPKLLTT